MTKPESRSLGRKLLEGWASIAARFGFVQTLLLLGLFYVTLIGPVALVQMLARQDPLDKRRLRDEGSAWRESESAGADLERAKLLT